MSMPEYYRSKFVSHLHNALSGFTGLDVDEVSNRYAFCMVPTLSMGYFRYSEQSKSKAIGITIETISFRPHLSGTPSTTPICFRLFP